MKSECRAYIDHTRLLCLLLAAVIFLAGCTNSEKTKAEHVAKGEAYLKESKFQEASLEFRNAIQIDEQLAAAHWGLARAYEGLERIQEMVAELERASSLDPNNLEARIKLGNIYILGSRGRAEAISAAERLAKEVIAKDPNHIEGRILMGTVLFNQDQREQAFAELNHAIELDPKRAESYLSLARFYVITNERNKAEELYKKAISVNANLPVAHVEYGRFLAQTNRPTEAEAAFRKAVEVGPTDRNARFVLASYYLVNKQTDKAEEAFKGLAGLEPDKPESQVVLGDFYSAVSRPDDAIRIYQEILSKSPDYLQGRYRLASILLARGDTKGASVQIEEAFKKDKNDRQALLLRAQMRAQTGQQDGLKSAIEDLKEVLKQEPNSRPALYYMAQINLTLGHMDEARAFAGELEKNYPDYLQAKMVQLRLALETKDHKTASALATDLITRLEKTAFDRENTAGELADMRKKAYLARGNSYLQLGNFAAARQDIDFARQMSPYDPVVYNSMAILALVDKKPQDAIGFFEQALKVDATNYDALNGLTTLYNQSQQLDKAHAAIDQALQSYPNVAPLHFLKAQAYGFQRNIQMAEAELNKALELDPNYVNAYFALGSLYINTKQEDRAIAEYQKIISKRPDDVVPYTLIGILEDQRKNHDAAAENYRKALEKDPNAVIAANNLAWLYAVTGKGNLDEALRLAQGVVQKNPNIAGFIDTLGWIYYKKNLHGPAVEQLRKAVSINESEARARNVPPSATYHYHLAMALKGKGEREESRRELEIAIRLSEKAPFPDVDEAKKALASL